MTPDDLPSRLNFAWHDQRRAWSNFSFRRHRAFDGYLVTMHQGGTHWLKYLLTHVITRELGLPQPRTINENLVIGGPHERPPYDTRPRLGHSHTIPGPLLHWLLYLPAAGFPRYVVLVRDMRDTLLAHYAKWGARYACSFAEYLRGDLGRRRFDKDIWWDIRFMNAWGALVTRHPSRSLVVRYEDLRADAPTWLARVLEFLAVPLADRAAAIGAALAVASKEQMAALDLAPEGTPVVRDEQRAWEDWYSAADRAWLRAVWSRFLRYDFGYGYAQWT
jgi:hypothetical protein